MCRAASFDVITNTFLVLLIFPNTYILTLSNVAAPYHDPKALHTVTICKRIYLHKRKIMEKTVVWLKFSLYLLDYYHILYNPYTITSGRACHFLACPLLSLSLEILLATES